MTVSGLSFSSQVEDWVRRTDQRLLTVFHESTQEVVSRAANNVPIDLGFARASIRASLQSMPQIDRSKTNKGQQAIDWSAALAEIILVIAGSKIGQTVYVGWTAAYVIPLEFGHSKQAPSGFVRLAAAQWPAIVDTVTQQAKATASR